MKRRKIFRRTLLISLTALLVLFAINAFRIARYSAICETQTADVAIVLGAGSVDGKLQPVFRERVHHAIKLYESGVVKALIFTGGFGDGQCISDSRAALRYARTKGLPAAALFIEERSTITYTNLFFAKEIMEQQRMQTALIVSDPLHMKRSIRMCKKLGIPGKSSPTQSSMYRSWRTKASSLTYETFFYTLGQLTNFYFPKQKLKAAMV